jgi:hypothetical protein
MHTYESVTLYENDYGHIGYGGRGPIQSWGLSPRSIEGGYAFVARDSPGNPDPPD